MNRKTNIVVILITLALYCINQCTKQTISNDLLSKFMCGYFNDTIGSITFIAYVNIVLESKQLCINKLWQIILLMSGCAFFWEVITPLFRKNTTSDFWDVVAYISGGILYWLLFKTYVHISKQIKPKQKDFHT